MSEGDNEPRVAAFEHLTIGQGTTQPGDDYIIKDATGTLVDMTGGAVAGQLRRSYASTTPDLVYTGVVVNGPAAHVRLSYTALQSGLVRTRDGVHDAKIVTAAGIVYRFRQGTWDLSRETTKP
jgi:hypothetical protein